MSFSEEVLDNSSRGNSGLELNPRAIEFLRETRKWANFLAVLGFIGLGIFVLTALFMGAVMGSLGRIGGSNFNGFMVSFVYIIIALIYFFPILYLYRFAAKLKMALNTNNNTALEASFQNLRSHYKFIGVLTIIMMAFYFLSFFIMIIGGIGAAAFG